MLIPIGQIYAMALNALKHYSEDELRELGIDDQTLSNPSYVRANPEIDNYDHFDAEFFGMNPVVAQITDPQQKVFLECAWNALESAGYDSERYDGSIGVFAGLSINTYLLQTYSSNREYIDAIGQFQSAMSNRGDHISTLTCYKLNLNGPGVTVQSACSTALTAVHLAAQCLLDYQADMVIAGASSIRVPHRSGYLYQDGGVASPDGHCRPFDANASGTVFGSGVGAVVMKRLEEAMADGDNILAILRGSAINNDGSEKIGYTAPSIKGQQRAIAMALSNSDIHPESIDYVETHGTGTPLGDPVEIEALTKAFQTKSQKRGYCAIGSAKSNVGHLDAAAGIAGLIKTVLALTHKQIPPSLHFESPNSKIDFASTPFFVNTTLRDWEQRDGPRRAGVSAFGIGGTNAHVVLEEAPSRPALPASSAWQILPIAGKSAAALEQQTENLTDYIKRNEDIDLADVAYTLQTGRRAFEHRRVAICASSLSDVTETLNTLPQNRVFTTYAEPQRRPVVFLFSAMGSHYPGVAANLYAEVPEFQAQLDSCLEELDQETRQCVDKVISAPTDSHLDSAYSDSAYLEPNFMEAPIFAMEYALAKTFMSFGIEPQAVMGDGVGEFVAATLAGLISLPEASRLLAARRKCIERLSPGAMLVVHQQTDYLQESLRKHAGVEFAGQNRESRCLVSGSSAAINAYADQLESDDIVFQRLKISKALNSSAIDAVSTDFHTTVGALEQRQPAIPMVSSLTGTWIGSQGLDSDHWYKQMRAPRNVSSAIDTLFEDPERILLEIGPGSMLMNVARLHPSRKPKHTILGSLYRPDSKLFTPDLDCTESRALMTTLGRLWLSGQPVNWERLHRQQKRRRVALPTYPFDRKRYWIDPPIVDDDHEAQLIRETDIKNWFYVPSWRQAATRRHRVEESVGVAARGHLLALGGNGSLAASLVDQLKQVNWNVERVALVNHAEVASTSVRTMRNRDSDGFDALFEELKQNETLPDKILYIWPMSMTPSEFTGTQADVSAFVDEFWSVVCLAKALGKHCSTKSISLDIVTNGLNRVTDDEFLDLRKTSIVGPFMAISDEYPNISCRCIDIVLPPPGDTGEMTLAKDLAAEISSVNDDIFVAYRNGRRWLRDYEPIEIDAPQDSRHRLRKNGVYLITGGLGGIGLTFAKHLAKTEQIRIVLLGRSVPLAANGDGILSSDRSELSNHPSLEQHLRELSELGAEVFVMRADVTDSLRMNEVVAVARKKFGAINGVIHAAGMPSQGVMQLKNREDAEQVLMPKVFGTMVINEIFNQPGYAGPLDFFLLCGSRSAIMGGFGQADYISANAFLDAFAEDKRRHSGFDVTTIDWCGWKQTGMLAEAAARTTSAASEDTHGEAAAVVTLEHPLLHRQVHSSSKRQVYETDLAVDTHWILADHRIAGNPVVPGTAYLEMVRAAFDEQLDVHDLEISEVYFLKPLRIGVDDQRTTILSMEKDDEGYRFLVESRRTSDNGNTPLVEKHAAGRVKLVERISLPAVDVASLVARCSKYLEVFTDEDSIIEDHGRRWHNIKKIHHGENEMLSVVELLDENASDLDLYRIHPALLDKAIGTGRGFELGDVPLMPYFYKRFLYKGAFPKTIFVHIRSHGVEMNRGETPTFDITITDINGTVLVEIDSFTLKRINDIAMMYKSIADLAPDVPKSNPADRSAMTKENIYSKLIEEESISPEEACDVFDRVIGHSGLSQVVVSTRNLPKLIERGKLHGRPAASTATQKAEGPKLVEPNVLHPRPAMAVSYRAPEAPAHQRIARIWEVTLGIDGVGVDDNFFDLGGDSVSAIQIAEALREEFGVEVPVVQLYESLTIRSLSEFFADSEKDSVETNQRMSRGARRRDKAMQRGLKNSHSAA